MSRHVYLVWYDFGFDGRELVAIKSNAAVAIEWAGDHLKGDCTYVERKMIGWDDYNEEYDFDGQTIASWCAMEEYTSNAHYERTI